jgi:hypothetical protein
MKLSEIKGERAIEALADLIAPAREILGDAKLKELIKADKLGAVQYALKTYKKEVLEILAITEGMSVEEFKETCTVMSLPNKLLEILTDKELMGFLYSQVPDEAMTFFGNVMGNTEEGKPASDSSNTSQEGLEEKTDALLSSAISQMS